MVSLEKLLTEERGYNKEKKKKIRERVCSVLYFFFFGLWNVLFYTLLLKKIMKITMPFYILFKEM